LLAYLCGPSVDGPVAGNHMDYFQLIFFAVFSLVAGSFLFGRLRYGSWTGAFLKGTIEQTYGEVLLSGGVARSQVLKVVELRDSNGQAFVGLVITAKAPLAASMTPYRLSKDQARELSGLLSLAAK
jgi:hypothetical protein